MSAYGFPKPPRGEFRRERKETAHARKLEVESKFREAKARDGHKCRRPECPHCRKFDLAIDACHQPGHHRKMGGDPTGERTERRRLFTGCRFTHDDWHNGLFDAQPLDADLIFDGPCAFYRMNQETGRLEHYATETAIGVSVAVGV